MSEKSSRRLPRNQTPSGTPKPCFGRLRISAGSSVAAASLSTCLRRLSRIFSDAGSVEAKATHLVVEQRHARFDRMRHAHPVDLRENVFRQVRLCIETHHLGRPRELRIAFEMPREPVLGVRLAHAPARVRWSGAPVFRPFQRTGSRPDSARDRRARHAAGSSCRGRRAAGGPPRSPRPAGPRAGCSDRRRRRADAAGSGRSRRTARRRRRPDSTTVTCAPRHLATRTTSGSPTNRRTARRNARSSSVEDADRIRLDDELVMIGAEMPGDAPRVLELVEGGLVEADRERLDPARRTPRPSGRRRGSSRRRRRETRRAARR